MLCLVGRVTLEFWKQQILLLHTTNDGQALFLSGLSVYISTLNPHNRLTRQVLLISPFYRWGTQGSEKAKNWPKVTEITKNRAGRKPRVQLQNTCYKDGRWGRENFDMPVDQWSIMVSRVHAQGIPWQSNGRVSALPLLGAQVWSLVGELRSHKPHGVAKKKKNEDRLSQWTH